MTTLYILACEGGKHYVGTTSTITTRIGEHFLGRGSAWTRLHRPIKVIENRPVRSPHDENNVTKDLMKRYGIDNVRGGAYSQIQLSQEQRQLLQKELRSTENTCYICGQSGHVAGMHEREASRQKVKSTWDKMLPEEIPSYECFDCGKEFNNTAALYAHRDYHCRY